MNSFDGGQVFDAVQIDTADGAPACGSVAGAVGFRRRTFLPKVEG